MDTKILEELGLTKNEVKVYINLLELGNTPAGPLIKRVGMHRAAVYNLLDLLIDKGLVSYILKSNRRHFSADDPKRLTEYLETKRMLLNEKATQLKKLIPKLRIKKQLTTKEQEGTIFMGKRGIKSILEDVLQQKKEWLVFGAEGKFKKLFPWYFNHHHEKRSKLKIHLRMICNESLRKRVLPFAKVRYLPKNYISPATTYIYSNTVVIIIWEPTPEAFVMKSGQVAESYRNFFELLWNVAVK